MPTKDTTAVKFLQSIRGQYIISQALFHAIETLNKVEPEAMREISNIRDMEYLHTNLFPMFGGALPRINLESEDEE